MIARRSAAINRLIDLADRKNAMVLPGQERQVAGFCFERRGMLPCALAVGTMAIRAIRQILRLAGFESGVEVLRSRQPDSRSEASYDDYPLENYLFPTSHQNSVDLTVSASRATRAGPPATRRRSSRPSLRHATCRCPWLSTNVPRH